MQSIRIEKLARGTGYAYSLCVDTICTICLASPVVAVICSGKVHLCPACLAASTDRIAPDDLETAASWPVEHVDFDDESEPVSRMPRSGVFASARA